MQQLEGLDLKDKLWRKNGGKEFMEKTDTTKTYFSLKVWRRPFLTLIFCAEKGLQRSL